MNITCIPDDLGGDPSPSRPVDLDFPTLGRLVVAEAQDLAGTAASIDRDLEHLVDVSDVELTGDDSDQGDEMPRSPDELIASLNGIGATAYRLARHVRTLVEFRTIHLARQADPLRR